VSDQFAVVVTTINQPTKALIDIQEACDRLNNSFYVIGDTKSPADFSLPGSHYFDMKAQLASGFRFAEACPTRHYARKNVGYLAATKAGAQIIVETDDDNIPNPEFWLPRTRSVNAPVIRQRGWNNVYSYFSDAPIWPRGLPLNEVRAAQPARPTTSEETVCPIQQGLADENPDVDAIYRLVLPLPLSFDKRDPIVLGEGVWCPFNSQNTTFWRETFPLLYLPYYCSFRMTDIWRSFVAQRIMWTNGWHLMFHSSTVYQERNEHDLMIDFRDEIPGYLNNDRIKKTLEDLDLQSGVGSIMDNMRKCYDAMIALEVIGSEERPLLDIFLDDMTKLGWK
jgi:hypothetical protein